MSTVSVVIPSLNEKANIGRAIIAAWRTGAKEVIVADGGSQDGTTDIARSLGALVSVGVAGRARQQNEGAALASGDVLLFQHADCRLGEDSIQQICRLHDYHESICGGFRQIIESDAIPYRIIAFGNGLRVKWFGMAYGDQGIFVTRTLFESLHGFADVPLMEDVLLSIRLRRVTKLELLPGPIYVSDRRWRKNGIVRQTIRNWSIATAFRCGVSPQRLAAFYPSHDEN